MAPANRRPVFLIALWTGILTGPILLAIEQALDFALQDWACQNGAQSVLRFIDLIALIAVASAGGVAWKCWQSQGANWPGDEADPAGVARFMAAGGVFLSAMFFLAILSHGISMFLIGVCQ